MKKTVKTRQDPDKIYEFPPSGTKSKHYFPHILSFRHRDVSPHIFSVCPWRQKWWVKKHNHTLCLRDSAVFPEMHKGRGIDLGRCHTTMKINEFLVFRRRNHSTKLLVFIFLKKKKKRKDPPAAACETLISRCCEEVMRGRNAGAACSI